MRFACVGLAAALLTCDPGQDARSPLESAQAPGSSGESRPPNILLIYADDLGYNDVGCYWSGPGPDGRARIDTPAVDRLAAEGIRFTDFYSPASVCTPARAGLLTGCYPPRVGLSRLDDHGTPVLMPDSTVALNPSEVTLAEALSACGYRTACIGKWHLGRGAFAPLSHGFDYHYGHLVRPTQPGTKVAMQRNGVFVEELDHEQLTRRYTHEALAFIRSCGDQPFFVYLAHDAPHLPLTPSSGFAGRSERGPYGDFVEELDASIGRLLDGLEALGLSRDTLVLFTSDNGPVVHPDDPDWPRAPGGSAYPLRAGKNTAFEGGFRVPFIARWPGRIPAGATCSEIASAIDLLPTLARIAGCEIEPAGPIDGRDITPLLMAEPDARSPHEAFFYYHLGELRAVRKGRFKLHFAPPETAKRSQPASEPAPAALYDLDSDIGERVDVAADHPEVVAELAALARETRRILGDALTGVAGTGVREPGRRRKP